MDRSIVQTGEIPRSQDFLFAQQAAMVGLSKLAQAVIGNRTRIRGLGVGPTSPAGLNVLVAPGEIYSLEDLEATDYGVIAADTSHTILKQGISLDSVQLSCPAPGTSGQSINYLIEAGYVDQDGTPLVLPFYNASNPSTPYSGPSNGGAAINTVRSGVCDVKVKAGASAATGSQVTPSVDTGYVGIAVVTVAYGATTITASDIVLYSDARAINAPTVDVGSAVAYNVTGDGYSAYEFGKLYPFVPSNTNTGACTVDFGPGAVSIKLIDGSDPQAGALVVNSVANLRFNGTNMVLLNPAPALLSASQTFNGAQIGAIKPLTVTAGVATPDMSVSNNFSLPLSGANVTLANPTNIKPGQSGFIFTTQDATGGWSLAFGSDWNFGINGVPSFSTAANAVNAIQYSVEASGLIMCTGWAS